MENYQNKTVLSRRCMICHDTYEPVKEGRKCVPVCNECFNVVASIWFIGLALIMLVIGLILTAGFHNPVWLLLSLVSLTSLAIGVAFFRSVD